jgi:Protein of unknown function (DUF3800)
LIDLDKLREGQICLHNLDNTDAVYTFYYDETNNIRKLYVDADGFNVSLPRPFVLGGIVHGGDARPIDIAPLRQALKIQTNVRELKLAHIAKGEFTDLLTSPKLTIFLRWIRDNGFFIHYHQLDPLYWSTVDIVDSILTEGNHAALLHSHALLKSDLTAILRSDLQATVSLFHRYGYPGLAPENRRAFLKDLVEFVDSNGSVLAEFNRSMLKGVLQLGLSLDELIFIEGNPENLLIQDFSTFYLGRIALFQRSDHVFDIETIVQNTLSNAPIISQGQPAVNFRFADSVDEVGIQLADVIVGILGKMHSFLIEHSRQEVSEARDVLAGTGIQNVELLRDLISASHDVNVAFLHHVASIHDLNKLDRFLRFDDGAYAE